MKLNSRRVSRTPFAPQCQSLTTSDKRERRGGLATELAVADHKMKSILARRSQNGQLPNRRGFCSGLHSPSDPFGRYWKTSRRKRNARACMYSLRRAAKWLIGIIAEQRERDEMAGMGKFLLKSNQVPILRNSLVVKFHLKSNLVPQMRIFSPTL